MAKRIENMKAAPLAFTDLETSGDVFSVHEILEIGLLLVDQKDFKVLDQLNIKVKPLHIENAVPAALELNGYNEAEWQDAVSLEEAVKQYAEKTKGALFFAYNATFDWGFMNEAFQKTGIEDEMHYYRFDVLSMAYMKLKDELPNSWNLALLAEHFGILAELKPHRAINGTRTAFEVYKKLV